MSDNICIKGYIYLLKLCDTDQRIIYKVGKTINFYKRYKKYNYAEILIFINTNDITNDENEIINIFRINCELDKGREFFLAKDDNFVLNLFTNYFITKINRNINSNNNNNISINTTVNNTICNDNVLNNTLINETIVNETTVNNNLVIETVTNDSVVNDTIVETFASIEIKKTLEKTCPSCNKIFLFPSRLKAHLETTIHCKKTDTEINNFFIKFEKKKSFKCEICFSKYTKQQNLNRHIENTKCKSFIEEKKLLNEIEKIKLQITKL